MKKAYAKIELANGEYIINIEVSNGDLTSGADGWTGTAITFERAVEEANDMLRDYCEDGDCENGGVNDCTEGERTAEENELNAVMTAAEAATEFGLGESTVRQALNRGQVRGRKSGETWLLLRSVAKARWELPLVFPIEGQNRAHLAKDLGDGRWHVSLYAYHRPDGSVQRFERGSTHREYVLDTASSTHTVFAPTGEEAVEKALDLHEQQ